MRILFTAGGSSGHVFPIVAVKRAFDSALLRDLDIWFLGGGDIKEEEMLKMENIKVKKIMSSKWRRYFSFKNFVDIFKFPLSFAQAMFQVWIYMPDIIFSKGGQGALPVVLAGWLYHIPIIIHESDSVIGSSNRFSALCAKKIAISFKETKKFLAKKEKKIVLTGNPIRKNLLQGSIEEARKLFKLTGERKIILIMGGSQGAEEINSVFIDAIYKYIETYEIIHICGEKNYKEIDLLIRGILKDDQRLYHHLYNYLTEEKLKHAYAAADVILTRAGAGAIFEIAALEKPSVLIPLAGGAQNHQARNAQYFSKIGASIVVEESNITPNFIFGRVNQVAQSKKIREAMKKGCREFAKPNAAKDIAKIIFETV